MRVAWGEEEADVAIQGGTLVNVYTGELIPGTNIGIKGPYIAYVLPADRMAGPPKAHLVIPAENMFVLPGLIDPHIHADQRITLHELARFIVPRGTTSIITDMTNVANYAGLQGVRWFLESSRDLPLRVFAVCPLSPGNPELHSGSGLSWTELEELLTSPGIVGIGEAYWTRVLSSDPNLLSLYARANSLNKTVEGHSAGARHRRFAAYLAAGISSCHEPTTSEEVIERIRQGIHVFLREGSIRRELDNVIPALVKSGVNLDLVGLCSDDLYPEDLVETGGMENIIRKAIELGVPPAAAIRMATLVPARHFRLQDHLGGIAPGRLADILITPDLTQLPAHLVLVNGRIVAEDGELKQSYAPYAYPEAARKIFQSLPRFRASDFSIPAPSHVSSVKVRCIHRRTDILTSEETRILAVTRGEIMADPGQDVLKVALVNPYGQRLVTTAFVTGFGFKNGAVACSLTWDVGGLIVVGASEQDMAQAINRVIELGGGFSVVSGGKIIAEHALPLMGITSELPVTQAACEARKVIQAINELGYPLPKPLLGLQTLTFVGVPELRLTDRGLVRVRSQEVVPIVV